MCVVALVLVGLAMHALPRTRTPGHGAATTGQVERALGWSLLSGLATGVGGSVVFCLEPPSRHGAAVPEKVLAFLLGLAVGVMMVLSILDMIIPKLLRWGLVSPAVLACQMPWRVFSRASRSLSGTKCMCVRCFCAGVRHCVGDRLWNWHHLRPGRLYNALRPAHGWLWWAWSRASNPARSRGLSRRQVKTPGRRGAGSPSTISAAHNARARRPQRPGRSSGGDGEPAR